MGILDYVEAFEWPYGRKMIHVRDKNEVALVLEDDLSVSKFYYRWIKKAVGTYLWDSKNFDPHAYGISLQRQHLVAWKGRKQRLDVPGVCPYKYMLVGTWGQLFFPRQ